MTQVVQRGQVLELFLHRRIHGPQVFGQCACGHRSGDYA